MIIVNLLSIESTGRSPQPNAGTGAPESKTKSSVSTIAEADDWSGFMVKKAEEIPAIIKKAFYIASTGRPGPVVVDVPKDVTSPAHQIEVCGVVTMEGTIDDHCGACFVEYTVKYAQSQ